MVKARALPCFVAVILCVGVGEGAQAQSSLAAGEGATARIRAPVRNRPAAAARVRTHLARGERITVLALKGAWAHIRSTAGTGWVLASQLSAAHRREAKLQPRKLFASNVPTIPASATAAARRKTGRRGEESAPAVRALWRDTDGTNGHQGGAQASAPAGRALAQGESNPSRLEESDVAQARMASEPQESNDVDALAEPAIESRRGRGRLALTAAMGFVSVGQSFDSDVATRLGKYNVSAGSAALQLGLRYGHLFGPKELGIDAAYRFTAAVPGFTVPSSMSGLAETLSILEHTLDLGLRAGYRFLGARQTALYGRLGYHMSLVRMGQSMATPLPSEMLTGMTIGGGLEVPHLSARLGLRTQADLLTPASRSQTAGLSDGQEDHTYGVLVGLVGWYRFSSAWALEASYQLSYIWSTFTGHTSDRLQNMDSYANRSNTDQALLIGARYSR